MKAMKLPLSNRWMTVESNRINWPAHRAKRQNRGRRSDLTLVLADDSSEKLVWLALVWSSLAGNSIALFAMIRCLN